MELQLRVDSLLQAAGKQEEEVKALTEKLQEAERQCKAALDGKV